MLAVMEGDMIFVAVFFRVSDKDISGRDGERVCDGEGGSVAPGEAVVTVGVSDKDSATLRLLEKLAKVKVEEGLLGEGVVLRDALSCRDAVPAEVETERDCPSFESDRDTDVEPFPDREPREYDSVAV